MNSFCFLNSLFRGEPFVLNSLFLKPFFELSFLNPFFFKILFFGDFDEKSFLAFLVSGKLDAKLSDNLLKKCFFRGV
ncbi:hypothetical protein BB431_07260 [Helicobacter pylori]|nr:hypothetical protein BB431_07260 [Helicobacter pylori]